MRRVNGTRLIGTVAMGAMMLAGLGRTVRAQAAQAPAAPATPAIEAPAAPVAQAPAAAAPVVAPAPVVAAAPAGGTIRGSVKASGVPLPGVSVTAANSLTGKKYATTTDISGAFVMNVPQNGRYVVKAELAAFASVTNEVVVNASSLNGGLPTQTAEFKMDLASRVTAPAAVATAGGTTPAGPGAGGARTGVGARAGAGAATIARQGRTTQTLSVQRGEDDADLEGAGTGLETADVRSPSLGGIGNGDDAMAIASNDTVAVSGPQGQTNALAGFNGDDLQARIQDMRAQGLGNGDIATAFQGAMNGQGFGGPGGGFGGAAGGFGGPGGGGPGGGGPGGGFGGGGGGFAGGGGRGGFGGGGFRGQNPNLPHGSFSYQGSDSVLNANSFSVTGRPIPKPNSDRNTLTASITGTPYIPGLIKPNPKQFVFLSLTETRNTTPSITQAIIPTAAQRLGDLSGAGTIYDPSTGLPYATAAPGAAGGCLPALYTANRGVTSCIPASELDPTTNPNAAAGMALLNYYPLPNLTPTTLSPDNYQTNTQAESHASQASARYNRSFGAAPVRGQRGGPGGRGGGFPGGARGQARNAPPVLRQSIAESFAYSHSASSSQSFIPQLGGKSVSDGYNLSSAYTVGYGRINSTATVGWNRSRSIGSNYFTDAANNPALGDGIPVGTAPIYNNPFYFGVPSISLTGGLSGFSDSTPSNRVNQTISFSEQLRWSHKRHNMQFGVDVRRIHADTIGGTNVLGSFTFSGFATSGPTAQATGASGGSAIADLLLGLPQQSKVTAGLSKIYLRGNSLDWFATDDWRARANLTFNFGLRWEYFSPYIEKYDHLVNLNVSGGGSGLAIANVCATAAAGCASVGGSRSLVNPDRSMYSPRIGIAWSPKYKFAKGTVVRAGYGINYNTGQYASFAQNLSFQQPFAVTQTNTLSTSTSPTTCYLPSQAPPGTKPMTLTSGFNCSTQTTQSNFGVNPNYRLGIVQIFNLGIQRTVGLGIVLNIDYNGSLGNRLDIIRAPNRTALGIANPTSGQFNFEDSLGYSRGNTLAVNARKRLSRGISLQATYAYGHSIDDASSVGGSGNSIAQNDQDLQAEESNSSFDVRHSLTGTWITELPFGPNRLFLNKGGWLSKVMDGYSVSGNYTIATGGFATPSFAGSAEEIAAGAGNSLRPNRVPGTSIKGAGSLGNWFNAGAFAGACSTVPGVTNSPFCLPVGVYGNASRNSIELPGTVSVSGSLSRTITLGDTRSLELRLNANNALNTVQYQGVYTQINSPQFGQVSSAAAMRSLTYRAQFRF